MQRLAYFSVHMKKLKFSGYPWSSEFFTVNRDSYHQIPVHISLLLYSKEEHIYQHIIFSLAKTFILVTQIDFLICMFK